MTCSPILFSWKRRAALDLSMWKRQGGFPTEHAHTNRATDILSSFPPQGNLDKAVHPSGPQFPAHKMGTSIRWDYSHIPPSLCWGLNLGLHLCSTDTVPSSVMTLRTWKVRRQALSSRIFWTDRYNSLYVSIHHILLVILDMLLLWLRSQSSCGLFLRQDPI